MQAELVGDGEGRQRGKGRVKGCGCQATTQETGAQACWALEAREAHTTPGPSLARGRQSGWCLLTTVSAGLDSWGLGTPRTAVRGHWVGTSCERLGWKKGRHTHEAPRASAASPTNFLVRKRQGRSGAPLRW